MGGLKRLDRRKKYFFRCKKFNDKCVYSNLILERSAFKTSIKTQNLAGAYLKLFIATKARHRMRFCESLANPSEKITEFEFQMVFQPLNVCAIASLSRV